MPLPPYLSGSPESFEVPAPPSAPSAASSPRASGAGTPSAGTPARRFGLPEGAGFLLAALALMGGLFGWKHFSTDPVPVFAVSAPTSAAKALCFDSSSSVDLDGHLATVAGTAVVNQLRSRHDWQQTVPRNEAAPATGRLDLQVRVVDVDSFSTRAAGQYARTFTIPATSGLRAAAPLASDAGYTDWSHAYRQVSVDQKAAQLAQNKAADQTEALFRHRSRGSDVTGCVAASLMSAPAGSAPDLLVVSDLQDTGLRAPDGSARQFAAAPQGATLSIVAACPSGEPARCQQTLKEFLGRMKSLGIERDNISVVRAEQARNAVASWLSN